MGKRKRKRTCVFLAIVEQERHIQNPLWPDSQKVSSLSQILDEILLKSEILVSAEILFKLRFTKEY